MCDALDPTANENTPLTLEELRDAYLSNWGENMELKKLIASMAASWSIEELEAVFGRKKAHGRRRPHHQDIADILFTPEGRKEAIQPDRKVLLDWNSSKRAKIAEKATNRKALQPQEARAQLAGPDTNPYVAMAQLAGDVIDYMNVNITINGNTNISTYPTTTLDSSQFNPKCGWKLPATYPGCKNATLSGRENVIPDHLLSLPIRRIKYNGWAVNTVYGSLWTPNPPTKVNAYFLPNGAVYVVRYKSVARANEAMYHAVYEDIVDPPDGDCEVHAMAYSDITRTWDATRFQHVLAMGVMPPLGEMGLPLFALIQPKDNEGGV